MPQSVSLASGTRAYSLSEAALATGISPDVLRVWERRYGFPCPSRSESGHRIYPEAQVEHLQLVRQMVDRGARPSRALTLAEPELRAALNGGIGAPATACSGAMARGLDTEVAHALALVEANAMAPLVRHLQLLQARRGAAAFVTSIAAPLTMAVGEAWHSGRIAVFQEHAYTQTMLRLLGQIATGLVSGGGPGILLTTLPGEEHGIGLAMAEVLLALEGCRCVSLGLQTPPEQILAAVAGYQVQAVALSFSAFFPPRRAVEQVAQMRANLPAEIALWVGGGCAGLREVLPRGVLRFTDLGSVNSAVSALPRGASRSE